MREFKTVASLLDRKERWTQCTMSRTKHGTPCTYFMDEAYAFCLMGAIYKVYKKPKRDFIINLIRKFIKKEVGHNNIASFNDIGSFTRVRKLVRLAKI